MVKNVMQGPHSGRSLHQRRSFFVGNRHMVDDVERHPRIPGRVIFAPCGITHEAAVGNNMSDGGVALSEHVIFRFLTRRSCSQRRADEPENENKRTFGVSWL